MTPGRFEIFHFPCIFAQFNRKAEILKNRIILRQYAVFHALSPPPEWQQTHILVWARDQTELASWPWLSRIVGSPERRTVARPHGIQLLSACEEPVFPGQAINT